ncbi:MAG: ATP-binding protein [Saprospiraceae bacterium]
MTTPTPLNYLSLAILVLIGITNTAMAQAPCSQNLFVLDSLQDAFLIKEELEILPDKKGSLSLADVQNAGQPFLSLSQFEESFSTPITLWGRVCISNKIKTADAPSEWVLLFSGLLTEVDIYVADTLEQFHYKTGEFLPVHQRNFLPGDDKNLVKITVPPNSQRTVYFRAYSEIERPLRIKGIWMRSLEQFYQYESKQKRSIGFFTGFILMMLAYSLILAYYTKDKAYLFYSSYLLSLIVWQSFNVGDLGEWLTPLAFPSHPQYIYFFKLATYFGLFSYLAFLSSFLNLKTLLPKWHHAFVWMIRLGVPLLIIDAYTLWSTNFSLASADMYSVLYIVLFVIVTYFFLWPLYKTKDKKGRFIIIGTLAMSGGFLLTAYSRFSGSNFTLVFFQTGIFIEVVVFSLGLAFRRKMMMEESKAVEVELEKNRIQKKANEEEAKRWRELSLLKTRLYNNITHEFRTPLTVIQGMAGQIAGNDRKKEIIHRNSQVLLRMVNQILDLSKLEAGAMPLDWAQGDLIQFLKLHVDAWEPYASEREINLFFYSKTECHIMDFDEEKLRQVLDNLLSNAFKFTPTLGKIVVAAEVADDTFEIEVKDTGIGISPEQLPLIFNRFYQVDKSGAHSKGLPSEKADGTGIGLALTKELVELMGGNISAMSEPGKGSSFVVRLPIHQRAPLKKTAQRIPLTHAFPISKNKSKDEKWRPGPNSGRPSLLIVEDNPYVVEYLQSVLEKEYLLSSAKNGAHAIEKVSENPPDLVLCDVMMPEMDGFEFCEKIKTDEKTAHIPVALLTAKATQQDKLEGLNAWADAYLTKPVDQEELRLVLRNLLRMKQKAQAFFSNGRTRHNGLPDESRTFLENAEKAILENLANENFGVVHLARKMAFSKSTLNRNFKASADISPGYFILSVRMNQARRLIETTSAPINEVAYQVGYRQPSHFSTAYKSFFGFSPSETPK